MEGDGTVETLMGTYSAHAPQHSGEIFCFEQSGTVRWRRKLGRPLHFGAELLPDYYGVGMIRAEKIYPDSNRMVIVQSQHVPFFPSSLSLFTSRGELRGEYWNAGVFITLNTTDMDGDSIKEILAGAYDNETGRAILMILDPRNMHGASHRDTETYSSPELAKGTEKYMLRFPASPFADKTARDVITLIEPSDHLISVHIANGCLFPERMAIEKSRMYEYRLTLDMKLDQLIIPDYFYNEYRRAFDKPLSKVTEEGLKQIEYWDGEGWVREKIGTD